MRNPVSASENLEASRYDVYYFYREELALEHAWAIPGRGHSAFKWGNNKAPRKNIL